MLEEKVGAVRGLMRGWIMNRKETTNKNRVNELRGLIQLYIYRSPYLLCSRKSRQTNFADDVFISEIYVLIGCHIVES